MRSYSVPFGRLADYPHPAPERTAWTMGQRIDSDCYCRVWSNRAAMARSIRMQQRSADVPASRRLVPLVKLGETEGY